MKKTRGFSRLPNVSGVHFEGFENVIIRSRDIVKKDIEDFIEYCKKNAKGTATRVILGEWGEGKTEAYYKFILPFVEKQNDYAFFVSASTLANCYSDEKTIKLLRTTTLTALRFLVAIFRGIRDETKDKKYKKLIPSVEEYSKAEDYVEEVLDKLLNGDKSKKIFIFIDEFEELLLNKDILKEIISGIKETINGVYNPIHENGKYEGTVHFFISCTPDAYYQLQVHEETSLIFGGLGRRAKVIDLPPIRKEEGLNFLYGLLRYSYEEKLPDPLPIENLGVFNLLIKICQNNLGNLTSLFVNIFNSLRENEHLEVLDYEHLLQFLKKEHIFVYGGQTRCIEQEIFDRVIKDLQDQKSVEMGNLCTELFKLFIGELQPFSINDLERRIGKNKKQIQNAINIINENIRSKEKIDKTIIKMAPVKEGKNLDDVLKLFEEYTEMDRIKNKKIIRIESHTELLEEFEDRITYHFLEGEKIIKKIFLPLDEADISIFFEKEISHEKAIELRNALRNIRSDDVYYIASDAILTQIFPTPVPVGLECITNRDLRLKLWREVSRDLAGEYSNYMPHAFLEFLKESEIYDFIDRKDYERYSIIQLKDRKTDTSLRVLFYPINGDVKADDIEDISNILKANKKVHLAVLLYTGEITPNAQEKISNKELGKDGRYLLLDIHLHPTLIKKILCSYKASIIAEKNDFDFQRFKATSREVITQDLMFDNKLLKWIEEQEKKGVVISQISTSARSLKEFSDALKFYINYIDEANSPSEIFKKNVEEILKFRKYGTKTGFLPSDFESSSKIAELSIDLYENGFLNKIDGVYKVINHPVENRILQIIKNEKKVTISDLKDFFVIREQKKKVLEDVYLNILEYKGKIKKEGNLYTLVDVEESYNTVKEKYRDYKDTIKKRDFEIFGHFYVVKDRGDNLIHIRDFDDFLTKIFGKIEDIRKESSQTDILLQKLSLCEKLIEQFTREIAPAIRNASKRSEEILRQLGNKVANIKDDMEFVVKNCKKWLRFEFDVEDIKDFSKIERIYKEIKETYNKVYSYDELNKLRESLEEKAKKTFKFNRTPEEAHYFNLKFYILEKLGHELEEEIEDINRFLNRIKPIFEEIRERENDLNNKLKILEIPDECRFSNKVLDALKSVHIVGDIETHDYKQSGITLRDIEKSSKDIVKDVKRKIDILINLTDSLDDLILTEKDFVLYVKKYNRLKEKVGEIFDTEEYVPLVKQFKNKIRRIKSQYDNFINSLSNKSDINEIKKGAHAFEENCINWKKDLSKEENIFIDEWRSYKSKMIKFTRRVKDLLHLLSKSHKIYTKEIDEKIEHLLQKIKPEKIEDLKYKISKLEKLKNEIRSNAMKIAEEFITPTEAKILDILYSKRDEKMEWISYEDLVKEVVDKYKLSADDVRKALENLLSKKYVLQGFSLYI